MNWWNQTRLVGLHEQLITRLRRWFLPYTAVYQADLAALVRSWVLRAWCVLTILVALVLMLNNGPSNATPSTRSGAVLAALMQPVDVAAGPAYTIRELLKFYVVIWVSFIIVLTGGTISSELGVVADSVLSRGISRWQYFLGKWTARLTAVLGVYLLVMVPASGLLWLSNSPPDRPETVARAEFDAVTDEFAPAPLALQSSVTLGGVVLALSQIAAVLAFVVTCGVAYSASFGNTVISIAVGWVSVYGTGLILSILDVTRFAPGRLIRELPDVLSGRCLPADHWWGVGQWFGLTLIAALASGTIFSRRDV